MSVPKCSLSITVNKMRLHPSKAAPFLCLQSHPIRTFLEPSFWHPSSISPSQLYLIHQQVTCYFISNLKNVFVYIYLQLPLVSLLLIHYKTYWKNCLSPPYTFPYLTLSSQATQIRLLSLHLHWGWAILKVTKGIYVAKPSSLFSLNLTPSQ